MTRLSFATLQATGMAFFGLSSVWVRVVDEVGGAVFDREISAHLPAANQFLAPRFFMNNGATAAAVAYDCSGGRLPRD